MMILQQWYFLSLSLSTMAFDGCGENKIGKEVECVAGESASKRPEDYGFSQDKAAECFFKLASFYYEQNFGRTKKEDVDLLMLGFYDEANSGEEGNQGLSDYKIGLQLGLDAAAVRRRRSKHLLVYGDKSKRGMWVLDLAKTIKNKSYRAEDKSITVKFRSQTICDEFQDYMDENNAYSDCRFGACRVTMDRSTFQSVVAKCIARDYSDVIDDEHLAAQVRIDQISQAVRHMLGERVGNAVDAVVGSDLDRCVGALCNCAIEVVEPIKEASHFLLDAVVGFFKEEGYENNDSSIEG